MSFGSGFPLLARHFTLLDQGATHVSQSQAAVLDPARPSDGAPLYAPSSPSENFRSTEVLVEQILATRILCGAEEAPTHPLTAHPLADLPRVEDTHTRRPKKGKPLPKDKLV